MLDVPSMHQMIYSTLPEIARTKLNCRLLWDIPMWLLILGISLLNSHSSLVGDDGSMGIILIHLQATSVMLLLLLIITL